MKKQILIVEDNELNRALLCEILSGDYQVLEAENGHQALEILQQCKEDIALILLDVVLPVMDGYAFLDRLKEDRELSFIPVIVMTQENSEADEVSALAHGATDFVPKPYRPQVLLHRVASLIKLRQTAAMVNQFKYDRLTGLYTKEYFFRMVRDHLDQHPEKAYNLVCLNVENFTLFKDSYGNLAGGRLLKEIADSLHSFLDTDGICCRYRTDRFIFLQERSREQEIRALFGKDDRFACIAPGKNVVLRRGIYEIIDPTLSVEQMCDRVLLAVDSIKGHYNEYYAVYDDALRNRLLRQKAITDAMETALTEKQFVVYYQPKYSLSSNAMAGAEALVRWEHPRLGFISPGEFIPLFEQNSFIPQLDRYIWEQVCAQLRDWKKQGLPLLPVSVNVSRADVYQTDLVETFQGLVHKYGIDPAYLHLEITESAYSEQLDKIIRTVRRLRRLGFIVEMDDFGSGYSSLNTLSQMELDILKLDMRFVQSELAKPAEQSILVDIITMMHKLNLRVLAEGVEIRSQISRLQAAGCDYVQGFFFAKPMPRREYEVLLKAWRPQARDTTEASRCSAGHLSLLVADEDSRYRAKVRSILDNQYHILEAADAQSALNAIRAHHMQGLCAVILSTTLPESGSNLVMEALRQEPAFWHLPVLAVIPGGTHTTSLPLVQEADDFLCKCHPLIDLRKRIQRLVDVASFRHRERVLQNEANRDALTGLLNRRGLQTAMAQIEKGDLPLAVCLFDLDDLKAVNDTYGHSAGDRMICGFADLLCSQTRSQDIRCRYGGDEFLVIFKHLRPSDLIVQKGESICRTFRSFRLPDGSFSTCSGGIALCTPHDALEDVIHQADAALYRAKHEGKGTCFLWNGADEPLN